jgi:hypothetical protein
MKCDMFSCDNWAYDECQLTDDCPLLKDRDYWKRLAEAAGEVLKRVPNDPNWPVRNAYLPGFDEAVKNYQSIKEGGK